MIHLLPIHAGHIGCPEVIALESPRLSIHLMPLGCGNDRCLDAVQIDPAVLSVRSAAIFRFLFIFRFFACFEDAQPISCTIGKRFTITGELKRIYTRGEFLLFLLFEIVSVEGAFWAFVIRSPPRHGKGMSHRERRENGFAFNAGNLSISSLRIGKSDDALGNAVHLNANRFVFVFLRFCRVARSGSIARDRPSRYGIHGVWGVGILLVLRFFKRAGLRNERIRELFLQRDEHRTHRQWEPQVKVECVVDRVEFARGEEVEIFSRWIPGRRAICKFRLRDEPRFA